MRYCVYIYIYIINKKIIKIMTLKYFTATIVR